MFGQTFRMEIMLTPEDTEPIRVTCSRIEMGSSMRTVAQGPYVDQALLQLVASPSPLRFRERLGSFWRLESLVGGATHPVSFLVDAEDAVMKAAMYVRCRCVVLCCVVMSVQISVCLYRLSSYGPYDIPCST